MNSNNKEHNLQKRFWNNSKRGVEKLSLFKLSKEAKISQNDIKFYFKDKNEIIDKFSIMIDSMVEAKLNLDDFRISSKKR